MSTPKRKLPAPLYELGKKIQNHGLTPEQVAWMDYFIPGSHGVMRNEHGSRREPFGVTDSVQLRRLEERYAASRMLELQYEPIQGSFDYAHMKAIHHHLFQDTYSWAGEQRTVDMSKNGHHYAPSRNIERLWEIQHHKMSEGDLLRGITDQSEFTDKLAEHWGMVNFAHAFREGNTRTQSMFFEQLAEQVGWDLDITRLNGNHPDSVRDEFVAARFHHQKNGFDHAPLAAALDKIISPSPEKQREQQRLRTPLPQTSTVRRRFPELAPDGTGQGSTDQGSAGPDITRTTESDSPEF